MEKVKIVIERSSDHFGAYAENVDGVFGAGETPGEAKKSALEAIDLIKEFNTDDNIPDILKGDYEVVYRFDVESLLNYYKGIFSNSALEKLTGINQKQLHHYASGLKKPREAQRRKISEGLHRLADELKEVEL